MEKGQGIEDELPQVIIQHIQSFLPQKEAVLTTVLSKSWYNSWLTRPTLDFDERDFLNCCPEAQFTDEFGNFLKRNLNRYNELNLKIDKFKLSMNVRDSDSSSLANELIVEAMKVGVNNLNLEIYPPVSIFVLPKEVLEAESLVGLSVLGCKIDGILEGKVSCNRLKSLNLRNVCIGDDVIKDLFTNCTLIEDLYMLDCDGLRKVNVGKLLNLQKMEIKQRAKQPVGVRSFLIEVDGGFSTPVFSKLSCLVLVSVRIDSMFFRDFSIKFPCLEDLTVRDCNGFERLDIASNSLKFISLHFGKRLEAKIDAPSIRKLKYSGLIIPCFSLIAATGEWESDIGLTCFSVCLGVSWLLELNQFLSSLSMSKISLRICFYGKDVDRVVFSIQDFHKPAVENLILTTSAMQHLSPSVCSALWEGLLWSFSPKFVRVNHEEEYWQLLSKRLIHVQDLEGWNLDFYNKTLREWQPLSSKDLVDASTFPRDGRKFRFQLRWKNPTFEHGCGSMI